MAKNSNEKTTATTTTEVKEQIKNTTAEATKGAFDILLETQTKFVDSLVENSKNFSDTFKLGESFGKTKAYFSEWLDKQEETLETAVEKVKEQVKFDNAPELVKLSLEAQQNLGKEWFGALKTTVKANDLKELNEILTANVKKLQENVIEVSHYFTENFGKPVNFTEVFSVDYAKEMTHKMVEMWKPAKLA
ncbi:MAG: hypothetical protein NW226_15595 [Microscillaceae bacterium]|nr:hypothetical protein [Microscillaceae bacterium]